EGDGGWRRRHDHVGRHGRGRTGDHETARRHPVPRRRRTSYGGRRWKGVCAPPGARAYGPGGHGVTAQAFARRRFPQVDRPRHPRGGGQREGPQPRDGQPLDGSPQMSVETATKPVITAEAQAAPVDTRTASLRAIYIIWYRDLLRYWRDRWRLVASLAQPLLFLIVFGSCLSPSLGGAFGRGARVWPCLVWCRSRLDDEVASGFSGGDELPDDAYVLSIGSAVPAHQPAGLDDGADENRSCFLRHRPDPARGAGELRPAWCQQPRADDRWTGAADPARGGHHARLRRGAPRCRGRHVSAPRLTARRARRARRR